MREAIREIIARPGKRTERSGLASAVNEEATPLFGIPDVEYCLTNCSAPFLGRGYPHAVDVIPSSSPNRLPGLS